MAYYSELQSSFNSCQPLEHARVKWHSRDWVLKPRTSVYLPLHRRAIIRWKFQPSTPLSSMQSYKNFSFVSSELCYDWSMMHRTKTWKNKSRCSRLKTETKWKMANISQAMCQVQGRMILRNDDDVKVGWTRKWLLSQSLHNIKSHETKPIILFICLS